MADQYVEVSHESWGSRLMNSLKGILFGILLFVASFVLLFWNEGRAVKTAKALAEGRGAVVEAPIEQINAGLDGKLVHVNGEATTSEVLADEEFAVSQNAVKLARQVEMYQWEEETRTETTNNTGGSSTTKTIYDYKKVWSDRLIDSDSFNQSAKYQNPDSMPYDSQEWTADEVRLGPYRLTPDLLSQWNSFEDLRIPTPPAAEEGQAENTVAVPEGFVHRDGGYYRGENPNTPAIGDLRVSFSLVPQGPVSIISQQHGDTFTPYTTQVGQSLAMLSPGLLTADAMFTSAERTNTMWTWGLRLAGFLAMMFGLAMVLGPLVVLADVLPFLGRLVGAGVMLTSGLVALCFSAVTIAIAWLAYRPILGIALLVVAAGSVALLMYFKRRPQAESALGTAAPSPAQPASGA